MNLVETKRCAHCGSTDKLELHHWAPQSKFHDANEWPMSWLCQECHHEWHRRINARSELADITHQLNRLRDYLDRLEQSASPVAVTGERLVAHTAVAKMVGLDYPALNRMVKSGEFPSPVSLTAKIKAWVESEINDWISKRIARREERTQ